MASTLLELILKTVRQGTGFQDAKKDVGDLGKATDGLNKVLGTFGLAVGAKELFDFGKASVQAALESAQAEAELQAVLVSSGQAAEGYKEKLAGLANELQNTSNFSDEAVMHAESVLLTFDKIGQETMPRATQAAADLAQMLGGDLQGASIQIGKALQGQISALQRSGVSFTEAETQRAEALFKTGHAAEAQGIILAALEKQVQGQAQAARDAAGGMQDWAVATGNLQEAFGGLLLAMGQESGVGGASVGLVETLTEGSTVWQANVEQIGLFVDALNRANETLTNTAGAVTPATQELSEFQKSQKGLEIIFLTVANAAIESTVGWEALATAYGEVSQEADAAAAALDNTAQAANDMSSASNRAASASYASMRGMMSQAGAARELENAFRQSEAAAASSAAAGAFGGQQDSFTQNLNLTQLQQANDARVAAQEKAKEDADKAAQEQQEQAKTNAQAMGQAVKDATSSLATDISSAVSDAVTGVDQNVIGDLLGLDTAETDAGEAVRRMAAVAAGGIQDKWAPELAKQLTGVKDATAQAFVAAFSTGDDSKLKATAQQLALNPIVELFDAQLIANQVEQKLRAGQLTQALNDKVNALLGEKGLPAIQSVTEQVGTAVTTTGDAVNTVGMNVAGVATTAETAMGQVSTALTGTIIAIDTVTLRIKELNKQLERTKVLAGEAGAAIGGLNPPGPGANGSGVPNGAERRMGGPGAL